MGSMIESSGLTYIIQCLNNPYMDAKIISLWSNTFFNRIVMFALLALVCFPIGCRSKKMVTEKAEISRIDTVEVFKYVHDTIIQKEREVVTKPVYFETEIPCDEDQKGKVGSGNNYTEYEIKDGNIYIKTNIDSISNNWKSFYHSKFQKDSIAVRQQLKEKYESTSVTKVYVYPWWFYVVCILGGLLLLWKVLNFFGLIRI